MADIDTELIQGNCIDVMGSMEPESVHAIVTDPPYGLAFMGKSWDDFEPKEYQEWCEEWAIEALRVLKPGGHMLAFSGSRTFHRLFVGVEDAGFEVRDTIMWMYGSGFPKGRDVGKAIDKKKGTEEERQSEGPYIAPDGKERPGNGIQPGENNYVSNEESDWNDGSFERTTAADPEAEKWDGWNSQLKPAFEPVVLARKPLEEDTIAEQVMATGTGALNINECEIPTEDSLQSGHHQEDLDRKPLPGDERGKAGRGMFDPENHSASEYDESKGRWPANVTMDEESAGMLDEQTGELDGRGGNTHGGFGGVDRTYGENSNGFVEKQEIGYGESGGPSRFFYTSKAKKSERTVGDRVECPHPTVKPIDLMEWMVKMVSAEEQIVLDPFAGSGTTLMAAYNVGRNGIGIEKDSDYMETAKERVRANEEYIDEVGTEPDHVYNEATGW